MKTIGELTVESKFVSGGVAQFQNGTVAAPGITFTQKLNTGLALDANKMMNVFNGSAQFSADANGLLVESGKRISFGSGGTLTPQSTKIQLSNGLKLEILNVADDQISTLGGISAVKNVGGYQDISLKDDINNIEMSDAEIDKFLSILPKIYNRTDINEYEIGLIANELFDAGFTYLVGETTHAMSHKKIKTVKYDRVSLYLMLIVGKMWKNK